jgi:hypothetical protein
MNSIEGQGGNLDTLEQLPFNYLYDHIIPQGEQVIIDDYSFDGVDPRRVSLPEEAVLLRTIIDIDPHVGGYFIAVAQIDSRENDHEGVAAYKISHKNNKFVYDGRLTFIASDKVTWFGANPNPAGEGGISTMQLTGASENVSDVHIGLTLDDETGALLATDQSENRTWRLSLSPEGRLLK